MQYLNILTALTALAGGVTALPFTATQRQAPAAPCPSTSLKAGQSTAFGWQIVGSAVTSLALDNTCSLLKNDQAQKWADEGLHLDNIQSPVCGKSHPNATTALPNLVAANTKTFTTLITNAFDRSTPKVWKYLCHNIRFKQLSAFLLDDATVVNATCQLAGEQLRPEPFVPIGGASPDLAAVAAYNDAQSKLFAYMYASSAATASDLSALCADAAGPLKTEAYNALQLDGACVEATICGMQDVIDVESGKEAIREWTSKMFVAVIENISNQPGYKKWLCDNLDEGSMETVGVDGAFVKGEICGGW